MRARRVIGSSIVVGAVVATFAQVGTASASGGGGCGGPVTDGRGQRVRIADFCFTPTILRVHRGDEVTFRNTDSFSHNVLGSNASWGSFRSLNEKKPSVTYRFTEKGIYPFACVIHPGMIGAVVVGGGPPMASGLVTTAAGPVVKVDPAEALASTGISDVVVVDPPTIVGSEPDATAWPAIALAVAAFGALMLAGLRRHRSLRLVAV
jgi:plastocyanin